MLNLDGIYVNTGFDKQDYKHSEHKVEVSFSVKRNVFNNEEFIGTLTLDGTEYSVLAAQKSGFPANKHYILLIKKDDFNQV